MRDAKKQNKDRIFASIIGLVVLATVLFFSNVSKNFVALAQDSGSTNSNVNSGDSNINQLNQQLQENQEKLKEVEQKKQQLEAQLDLIQKQSYSISKQVQALDNQVQDTQFEIEKRELEMEQNRLEIEKLTDQINQKQRDIDASKGRLSDLIRLIDSQDQIDPLFVLLSRDSFSSYLDDIRSAADIQVKVQNELASIKQEKEGLDTDKQQQLSAQQKLSDEKEAYQRNIETLDQQKTYQQDLLAQSKQQEVPFQQLIDEAKKQEDYANAQIAALENAVRSKILSINNGLISSADVPLAWPIIKTDLSARTCKAYITCSALYHDSDYYKQFGRQHAGVDIPMPQGSPVYAPADGYVVGVVSGGACNGVGCLSVLKIAHTDSKGIVTNMSTKYLHMSKIIVRYNVDNPQFVKRGDLLGYSGGLPGTMGSGGTDFSTGPHLHLEVQINGISANPLSYLP